MTEVIKLKNGSEEAKGLVTITMLSLESLLKENPIAFYEFTMKCRDRQHTLFGNTEEVLRDLALLEQRGSVHESIRNIVLSAVEGEGLDMKVLKTWFPELPDNVLLPKKHRKILE